MDLSFPKLRRPFFTAFSVLRLVDLLFFILIHKSPRVGRLRQAEHCYLHNGMLFCKMDCAILLRLGGRPFYIHCCAYLFDSSFFKCSSFVFLYGFEFPRFRRPCNTAFPVLRLVDFRFFKCIYKSPWYFPVCTMQCAVCTIGFPFKTCSVQSCCGLGGGRPFLDVVVNCFLLTLPFQMFDSRFLIWNCPSRIQVYFVIQHFRF